MIAKRAMEWVRRRGLLSRMVLSNLLITGSPLITGVVGLVLISDRFLDRAAYGKLL
jgi:hypothetical protein